MLIPTLLSARCCNRLQATTERRRRKSDPRPLVPARLRAPGGLDGPRAPRLRCANVCTRADASDEQERRKDMALANGNGTRLGWAGTGRMGFELASRLLAA